jgi:CRP-like cAMP-binding protein
VQKLRPGVETRNQVLNAFDSATRQRVDPHIERLEVKRGDVLCDVGSIINYAYFPDSAVLSLLMVLENGSTIDTVNIGREGAFAICLALYSPDSSQMRSSFSRCIVQLPGGLLRVPVAVLRRECDCSAHIRDLVARHEDALKAKIQQTVACYALHTTQERIARWLLEMHDRAGCDALPYTHDFLSQILGINRKSVTLAVQALEKRGLLSHRRGRIQVGDCAGLERAACECYASIKKLRHLFETQPYNDSVPQIE